MVFSDLHNSFVQIPLPFLMFWTNIASLDGDFDYVSSFTASQANLLKRKTTRTLEVTRWICYCFKVHAQFSDMHTQTTKPFTASTGAEIVQVLRVSAW